MFCHSDLGKNEAIEHFPVGRRLAFDAAKGRLWAVCRSCERWNLSPLEERWEAIEECEKLFSISKLRVSTDNIGLARLKEGTTLVRVGEPQRPEMAAWRYGDQFHRRRRKYQLMAVGAGVAVGGVIVAGPVMGLLGGASFNLLQLPNLLSNLTTVARVPVKGTLLKLTRQNVRGVGIRPTEDGGFELDIPHRSLNVALAVARVGARVSLTGDEALRAARILLPQINKSGGRAEDVGRAVDVLEMSRGTNELFSRYAFGRAQLTASRASFFGISNGPAGSVLDLFSGRFGSADYGQISTMSAPVRLALEMSLHEEDERRALEGELAELEDRWREAEEVAAISDNMLLSSGLDAMLTKLKGGR
jgi:hypothetical protein